jgi:hypothetical protein
VMTSNPRCSRSRQKLPQAVTGIVLLQVPQPVPDDAIREHDLQTQHQIARIAKAQVLLAPALVASTPPICALPSELTNRQRQEQLRRLGCLLRFP